MQADAADLPLPSDSADLFLSFWGIHCFNDPPAALAETARVLKPGARLIGACFVCGSDSLRQRALVRPHMADFGPIGTQDEIEGWMAAAGFDLTTAGRSGPMLRFEAVLASAPT